MQSMPGSPKIYNLQSGLVYNELSIDITRLSSIFYAAVLARIFFLLFFSGYLFNL